MEMASRSIDLISNKANLPVQHAFCLSRPLFCTTTMLFCRTKTLFTWSGGPRSSGVGFFCFVSSRA